VDVRDDQKRAGRSLRGASRRWSTCVCLTSQAWRPPGRCWWWSPRGSGLCCCAASAQ